MYQSKKRLAFDSSLTTINNHRREENSSQTVRRQDVHKSQISSLYVLGIYRGSDVFTEKHSESVCLGKHRDSVRAPHQVLRERFELDVLWYELLLHKPLALTAPSASPITYVGPADILRLDITHCYVLSVKNRC